ncbi:hypothetical protein XI06_07680 [Bradyrhizobium sp. CCBAU 11434]|nr:hypothetical protein [Bradyrhizobium sp. CCBAU 11434]
MRLESLQGAKYFWRAGLIEAWTPKSDLMRRRFDQGAAYRCILQISFVIQAIQQDGKHFFRVVRELNS